MCSQFWASILTIAASILLLLYIYVRRNDSVITRFPPEALAFSPHRCSVEDIHDRAKRLSEAPISSLEQLPPKTGRYYIVVGGTGFVGGWIVAHLLQRGEDPRKIRILDICPPTRPDLTTDIAREVAFFKVDVRDAKSVEDAFKAPWPSINSQEPQPQITVFHVVANIRFYERHPSLVPYSATVNVDGTKNVISAARSIGASVLVYTSSSSVAIRNSRFWLWPWETEPKYFVQVLNDDDSQTRKPPDGFFSNYAFTKNCAEQIVRAADGSPSGEGTLRTGCLRPGNGVFGPGGDLSCGAYLARKTNPTWISTTMQSFTYVENCSIAHLLYEQRLLEIGRGESEVDIGGQAFSIADPGPPPTFADVQLALETLTDGETQFPPVSPTLMLLVAHIVEIYYLTRHFLLLYAPPIGSWLPSMSLDVVSLQPSLFRLTTVHIVVDDSRARLPPEKGGLGYKGICTTLEGLHLTVDDFKKSRGNVHERSKGAGISFRFALGPKNGKTGAKAKGRVDGALNVEVLST